MAELAFEIAALAHAGIQRLFNEDHVVVDPARGLAVVADGMGGERGGDVAARTACAAIAEVVETFSIEDPALHAALEVAAGRVHEAAVGGQDGMGTTVAAVRVVATEAIAEIAHVGDVRVYVLRKTSIAQLPSGAPRYCPPTTLPSGATLVCTTRDHSSVCELVERGHLERAAARSHPLRSRISRALGKSEPRADLRVVTLLAGDRLLVCSDGLWAFVDETTIGAILESKTPEDACRGMIDAALAAGGPDNIGVAVVHWHGIGRAQLATSARRAGPTPAPPIAQVAPPVADRELPKALRDYARDLTAVARRGELDPVIGREHEILELSRALVARRKSNALLVGEPGVGKTSIVEALAQRIAAGKAGREIGKLQIAELSLTDLVAGTKLRGELEERIAKLLDAAEDTPDLVLFVDEIHAMMPGGEGPSASFAAALKPALARGKLRLVGATTTAEMERHLSRDEAFLRRFEIIQVPEPTTSETRTILAGLREKLAEHYEVSISDAALDAAIDLSMRYMADRRLPDKAVDLLDRACARRMLESRAASAHRSDIGRAEIAQAVADRCRLPLALVERDARSVLANLERRLRDQIKGQDRPIAQLLATLKRAHGPLRDPERPLASILLAGPTGVGKTATAKLVAELVFGRDALVRIDMSEYGEEHAIARLLGAPPGYTGHGDEGQLTGPVRRRPACVVLLDEIEKAHPDVLLLLLQLLGDGVLTDARGRPTSFREAIVVMTTNLPLADARRSAGFVRGEPDDDDRDRANREALAEHLAPELVGRIDAVLAYRALGPADRAAIVDAVASRLEARLREQGVTPPPGEEVRRLANAKLASLGFGVRQVERVVEQVIADALELATALGATNRKDAVVLDSIRSNRSRVHVAMLLIELAEGDADASALQMLATMVRCHDSAADLQFLKHTDAGALALYGSVESALEAARELASLARDREIPLSRVVHYGRVRERDALVEELRRSSGSGTLVISDAAREQLNERRHS